MKQCSTRLVGSSVMLLSLAAVSLSTVVQACNETITWKADLTGDKRVPSLKSTATANAQIVFNLVQPEALLTLDTKNIPDVTGAELHVAYQSSNGPAIFSISAPMVNDATKQITEKISAETLLVHPEIGIKNFTDVAHAITDGRVYVTLLTKEHPEGEIRGQIGMRKELIYSDTDLGFGHDASLHKAAHG